MNSDQYFHRGLRLIVASVLVFFLIVLFCVMVSRGFPFWMALVLLVPAGLCVAGLYYFSIGTSADLSERFFRRFRREQPKPEEISTVEEELERIAVDATDEKSMESTVAISDVIPGDRIGYGDLCHYGWNVWNAFKGARNQFYDQSELAEWLKLGFESLGKYNTKTLRAKLRATDGGYGIRLVENLKEYIQQ